MRFMVIVKATKNSEAGMLPSEELLAAMGNFNIDLAEYIHDLLLSMWSLLSRTVRRIEVKDIFTAGEAGVT